MWGKSTGSYAEDEMSGAFEAIVVVACIVAGCLAAALYGAFKLCEYLIK